MKKLVVVVLAVVALGSLTQVGCNKPIREASARMVGEPPMPDDSRMPARYNP